MRDSKGRFCKDSKLTGRTVTIGAEWLKYRKNACDVKLKPGSLGVITSEPMSGNRVYVSWDGLDQPEHQLDYYVLGREVVLANRRVTTKFSAGDVVNAYGLEWCVESVEANRCLLISRYGRTIHRWAKLEDMENGPMFEFKDGSKVEAAAMKVIEDACKPQIVPGSVVRLRSGGPDMSVESIDDYGMAMCVWLYGPAKCSGPFSVMCLEFVR